MALNTEPQSSLIKPLEDSKGIISSLDMLTFKKKNSKIELPEKNEALNDYTDATHQANAKPLSTQT